MTQFFETFFDCHSSTLASEAAVSATDNMTFFGEVCVSGKLRRCVARPASISDFNGDRQPFGRRQNCSTKSGMLGDFTIEIVE